MSQSNNPASQRRNQVLVYGALISIVWISGCTVLSVFGWLNDSVAKTVSIIGAVLAVIAVTWWASVNSTIMLRRSYMRPALASILTIVLLTGGIVFYQRNVPGSSTLGSIPVGFPNTGVASSTDSSTVPFCEANQGGFWRVSLPGTALSCTNAGLAMWQNTSENDAKVLLDQSGGDDANPSYGVGVNVAFQRPGDTQTWAGVIVQSPSDSNVGGGYIFKITSAGQWQLQHILNTTFTAVIARGVVSVNPKRVGLRVAVPDNGKLYCYVNGKQVFSWRDGLDNPPGPIGLIVTRAHGMSSTIVYSNFVPMGNSNS